jgi:hypothetical protein
MTKRFLIRHPKTGAEYGLTSVKVFRDRYEPQGFVIPDEQPNGWEAPAKPAPSKAAADKKADAKDAE